LAISLDGSNPVQIRKISSDLFKSIRSYSSGQFALQIDGASSVYFSPWLNKFLAGQQSQISGNVYLLTKINSEKIVREFYGAYITEIGFPALNASNRKPGHLLTEYCMLTEISRNTASKRFCKVIKNLKSNYILKH